MEIKTICTLYEKELNAIKTIVSVDCAGVSCDVCPLYAKKSNECVRAFLRLVLTEYDIDYLEGGE